MALKYYYDLMSQPSRAVYIFMKVNKIPFDGKPVAIRKGEHITDQFAKLNPFKKVPVIDDNGFILTESVAILKYLSYKFNVADNWYPRNDFKAQSRIDEYMNWQHMNTRLNAAMIFQHYLIIPRMTGKPPQEKQLAKFKSQLKDSIHHIDTYFLRDRSYLCGNDISLADILGVCELMQLQACHEEQFYTNNPKVQEWIQRVRNRLAPHFDEAHSIVYRVGKAFPAIKAKI